MIKWNAQDLLDMLNKETNQLEIDELYKALIAYSLGCVTIENDKLEKVLNYYYDNDQISSFINPDLLDKADELLEDIH